VSRLLTIAQRVGIAAITTFLVFAVVLLLAFLAIALNESRAANSTVGTVVCAVMMGSLVLLFLKLNDRRERRAGRAHLSKPKTAQTPQTRPFAWVLVIILFLIGTLVYSVSPVDPKAKPRGQAGPPIITLLFWSAVAIIVAVYAGLFLLAYLRNRAVNRFFERANKGDPDGAIAALRGEIASKGATALRLNSLGLLLASQQRWEEGDEQFREVIRLYGRRTPQLNHHALATWKLGRTEESAALFAEIAALGPLDMVGACQYSRVFAELGRSDEAREQLAHAELQYGRIIGAAASVRSILLNELQECRDAVAGLAGGKKDDLSGLDEL